MRLLDSRALGAFFVVMISSLLAILFAGAIVIGVSWDERLHLEMAGNWKKYGVYQRINAEGFAYGPVATLYGHVIAFLLGAEKFGAASFSAEAYTARHLSVALLAVVGAASVGGAVWLVTRSTGAGLLGATLLLSIPLWVGHGMFNPKDIAVATGYTLITLGAIAIALAREKRSSMQTPAGAIVLILGIGLSAGTRTIMLLVGVGSVVLAGILLWLTERNPRELLLYFRTTGLSLFIGFLFLSIIYPKVFLNLTNLGSALTTSADYPWVGETLLAGMVISPGITPWYYLPAWFFAQVPLFVQVFFWFGVCTVFLLGRSAKGKPSEVNSKKIFLGATMLLSQSLVLPLAATVLGSTMYDSVRHFLFVLPGVAGSAAIGLWFVSSRIQEKMAVSGLVGLIAVGMGATLVAQIQLFPYSYTYFNPIVSLVGVDGNWPTDYWRTSARELIPLLPSESLIACDEWLRDQSLASCEREHQFAPYWDTRGSQTDSEFGNPDLTYILVRTNRGEALPPEECELLHSITRAPFGLSQTMSWAATCPSPLK